jgi:hypothetical protein
VVKQLSAGAPVIVSAHGYSVGCGVTAAGDRGFDAKYVRGGLSA